MGRNLQVRNPRTGRFDYQIEAAPPAHIKKQCAAIRDNARTWQAMGHDKRVAVMHRFQTLIRDNRVALADAVSTDTGRRMISFSEVDGAANAIDRWIGVASKHLEDQRLAGEKTAFPDISFGFERKPYHLVGVISPWNFPLTLSLIDALPALIAGCGVILKPSEITPRIGAQLRQVIAQIPELHAVFGIVDGDGRTGAALINHVDAICFTGSVNTGRKVALAAAKNFIPAFLELGGNDPAIVLEDADIERAATALLRASIVNTGQACQSIERIYVARAIYQPFCNLLVDKAATVILNQNDLSTGHIGPLIFVGQEDIIAGQLNEAVQQGARILTGGTFQKNGGVWMTPTIITEVKQDMRLMQEETFGPVMPIMPFDTEAEAIDLANDTTFGLSGAVFSNSLDHALNVASAMDAGAISINDASLTGFVGEAEKNSFKLSGMGGSRMGEAGYLRFFRKKALIVNSGAPFPIERFDERQVAEPDTSNE